jgi:hypothetical protein
MRAALRERTTRPDTLQSDKGDLFQHWRLGPGRTTGGFKVPAVVLGQYRALVVGYQSGHLVTAHVSRCFLHRGRSHEIEASVDANVNLPPVREKSLESPTDLSSELSALDEPIGPLIHTPVDWHTQDRAVG